MNRSDLDSLSLITEYTKPASRHREINGRAMGNEASRLDGVSPQGIAGGAAAARAGSSSRLPTTPISTPTARRAKSFSAFQPMSPSPSTSSNGSANGNGVNSASTPRAAANAQQSLQRQQSNGPKVERTIQRMDKAIRKRVRGGITYNMKIIIRGEKGTGKTSLFHRLKGEPIPSEHESTPQLQSATINWNFRADSEENVKCEVWDVVDRGFNPLADGSDGSGANGADGAAHNANPFELGSLQSNSNFASVRASAAVAASIAGASGANGSHTVATVDASTVDVYHETHGAIFLLDVTKWHTLEYVRQQLEKVPVHIPTLVLGNFRDCGNQRKIFKEDIQDLLYGNNDRSRQQQQLRRPHELLYFECSLLNCYGLKSLHQYFGIPFLQLKLATIRQQMRIVEGEFSHLKNDLQAKISEQRYSDYVEHIKSSGSDIRTGRKVPGGSPPPIQRMESTIVVNGSQSRGINNGDIHGEQNGHNARESAGRSHSTASNGSDIVVVTEQVGGNGSVQIPTEASPVGAANTVSAEAERQVAEPMQKDLDDLPERTNSLADQLTAPLKFTHSESLSSLKEEVVQSTSVPAIEKENSEVDQAAPASKKPARAEEQQQSPVKKPAASTKNSPVKASADEPVSLEDFQVPKQKNNDLDSFYSDDDSDADGDSDEDVIIPPSAAMTKKYSHKQQFIYSDSSDSDDEKTRRKARKNSPRRRGIAKAAIGQDAAVEPSSASMPKTLRPTVSDAKPSEVDNGAVTPIPAITKSDELTDTRLDLQSWPPSSPVTSQPSPTARPISPAARTSRSPSPRQKLESSRAHNPKSIAQESRHESPSTFDGDDGEEKGSEVASETREAEAQEIAASDKEALVISTAESPSGHSSPRRRLQPIRSVPSSAHRSNEEDSDERVGSPVCATEEYTTAAVSSSAEDEHKSEGQINGVVEESNDNGAVNESDANETISAIAEAVQTANLNALGSDLDYTEDDEHVVLSDGMGSFFSDEEDEKSVSEEAPLAVEAEEQAQTQLEAVYLTQKPVSKRPEMLESDVEANNVAKLSVVTTSSSTTPAASVKLHDTHDAEVEFTVPVMSEPRMEVAFFSKSNEESDDDEDEEVVKATVPVPVKAPSSPVKASRFNRQVDMLMSDEESESEQEAIKPPVVSRAVQPNHRPEMLMSDEDSDVSIEKPVTKNLSTMPQSGNTTQASSMLSSPVDSHFAPPSPAKNNDLESFFNESDSEGDDVGSSLGSSRTSSMLSSPPARTKSLKGPMRRAVMASDGDDDDEEESVDRFSSYNAKVPRKSKAERKQEREEIRRMTASLSSSSLTTEDLTPVATTVGSTASADVLAAIRLAQEEALRMLPPSDDGGGHSDAEKKSRPKKKKSSSSSSSSRSKLSEDASASSSSRKKKSSSSSKTSSSSRSSRRRDGDSGDERRESRRR